MDTEFVQVKNKRNNIIKKNKNISDSNEQRQKIAKHAASSKNFQLPTNNRFSNLNEINLTDSNSNLPSNINLNNPPIIIAL